MDKQYLKLLFERYLIIWENLIHPVKKLLGSQLGIIFSNLK
jgi:hypothetical protein